MPEYLYRDGVGHVRRVVHRMLYQTAVLCDCGAQMHRVPQVPGVNWNGNRATHQRSQAVQDLLDTAPERRDKFEELKESHERENITRYHHTHYPV